MRRREVSSERRRSSYQLDPLEQTSMKYESLYKNIVQLNTPIEYGLCKIAAILFRPQYVKISLDYFNWMRTSTAHTMLTAVDTLVSIDRINIHMCFSV